MHAASGGPVIARRRPTRGRGWACAALACSLIFVCPPLPVLGAILGLVALRRTGAGPGRSAAVAAILIGGLVTCGWAVFALWWNVEVRRPLLEGPRTALAAAASGDVATFRASLAAAGDAADAEAFVRGLEGAGPLRRLVPTDGDGPRTGPVASAGRVPVHYRAEFADREMEVVGRFVIWDGGPVLRFDAILIRDADSAPGGVMLAYPAEAPEDGRWPPGFLGGEPPETP